MIKFEIVTKTSVSCVDIVELYWRCVNGDTIIFESKNKKFVSSQEVIQQIEIVKKAIADIKIEYTK